MTLRVSDAATPALNNLLGVIGDQGRRELNQIGARAALEGVKDYHRAFDAKGGWFNRSLSTWGGGRTRTQWPQGITRAWSVGTVDSNTTVITNAHPHFRHKVYGGTIRPRSGKWLTIPIDPRAHGRTTKQFERVTGYRLFRPRGRFVLMFSEGRGRRAKTAYVLKSSITHKVWPGAMPIEDVYVDPFLRAVAEKIGDLL